MNLETEGRTFSFSHYHEFVEAKIRENIPSFGEKTKLRDACAYALTNGGKRVRPLIVLFVAEALGLDWDVYPAALSVEFFHTASLIADDLPCMDNDDERREKPSVHKVYGESIALLASYALITSAFEKIHENAILLEFQEGNPPDYGAKVGMLALETASRCAGILGATGGQFFDLFPPNYHLDTVKQVIYQKTVTLFEVSFVFGWLFGGGNLDQLDLVKKAAYHFGMAFQTADDINDWAEDLKKEKKMSMVQLLGIEGAKEYFYVQMDLLEKGLETLGLRTPPFERLCQILKKMASNLSE